VRRAAGVAAAAGAALVSSLPPAIGSGLSSPEGVLAVAASVAAVMGLTFASVLLPPAVALYAAELVVSVHRGALAVWSIPLFAVLLIFVYEAGDVRHQLPPSAVVELGPLRALVRRIALAAALGAVAAVAVLAAAGVSNRGGPAAAVVGGLFAAASVLLVRMLAPR
jgi:hypothetical protein